ncbi:MAG TPA: glycosyltransferase family 4 protein [Devosiaceae bacterium]|jgi:glycosyltransferase involved in cell wall biosynthesis
MSGGIVVSQMGARMHYAVPRILNEAGLLERLYTDICAVQGFPRLLKSLPRRAQPKALRRLLGRVPVGIPPQAIRSFPTMGALQVMERMRLKNPADETVLVLAEARAFSRAVVRRGFCGATGFYGIAGECLEQLRAARAKGLWTAVEQIIAPRDIVESLVAAEATRFPAWGQTAFDPHAWAFGKRERNEWDVADLIVCPSEFVRAAVIAEGGPAEKCVVVPYGIDPERFRAPVRAHDGPLRVLTVGAIGLRKGSPYVVEAARRLLATAEFRMVGGIGVDRGLLEAPNLTLLGQIPRAEIAAQFAWADVFLLPSACEGSATVTYEALAAGLPLIVTPNTGSVVEDGVSGIVVPLGDIEAIVAALRCLDEDRDKLAMMSAAAVERGNHFDLDAYGRRLLEALAPLRRTREPVQ